MFSSWQKRGTGQLGQVKKPPVFPQMCLAQQRLQNLWAPEVEDPSPIMGEASVHGLGPLHGLQFGVGSGLKVSRPAVKGFQLSAPFRTAGGHI